MLPKLEIFENELERAVEKQVVIVDASSCISFGAADIFHFSLYLCNWFYSLHALRFQI